MIPPRTASALLLGLGLSTVPPMAAGAAELGSVVDGRRLAAEWCGACHLTEPGRIGEGPIGAPSLQERAEDPGFTEHYLRTFLKTPHATMPLVNPTQDQADDLVAYLMSLKQPQP